MGKRTSSRSPGADPERAVDFLGRRRGSQWLGVQMAVRADPGRSGVGRLGNCGGPCPGRQGHLKQAIQLAIANAIRDGSMVVGLAAPVRIDNKKAVQGHQYRPDLRATMSAPWPCSQVPPAATLNRARRNLASRLTGANPTLLAAT